MGTYRHGATAVVHEPVVGGAFEECLGLFEQMTDEQRVTILLDLLGRKVRVTLDSDLIAAA